MGRYNIINLSKKPDLADTCSAWSYGQWGCLLPENWGVTLTNSVENYKNRSQSTELPQTWVCLRGNDCIGMVSLKDMELEDYKHLSPWVGSLYVHPYYRGQGIGQSLMLRAEEEAKKLRYNFLHLFTSDAEDYYKRILVGWDELTRFPDPIKPEIKVPLLRKHLN